MLNYRLLWQAWSVKWSRGEGKVSLSLSRSVCVTKKNRRKKYEKERVLMNTCVLPTSRLNVLVCFPPEAMFHCSTDALYCFRCGRKPMNLWPVRKNI